MTRGLRWAALALALLGLGKPLPAEEPPLGLALCLDTSGSVTARDRAALQAVAEGLVGALPAGAEVAVFAFDDQSRQVLPRTTRLAEVVEAARGLHAQGRYTALYDAIYDASRTLGESPGRRKAIVLVTDGKDENSALDLEDGVKMARDLHIPIVTVGVGRVEEKVLRRMAKLTGGEYLGLRPDGARVAARVMALAPEVARPPAATPPPAAAPPAGPVAAAGAPPRPDPAVSVPVAPGRRWVLWALVLLFGFGGLLAIAYALARRTVPVTAALGGAAAPEDEGPSPTMVTRLDGVEDGSRTLVLTLRPLLHVTRGAASGRIYEVGTQAATSIGRAQGNDVVLEDQAVSAQHCRIRPADGGGFEIIDLKSTNGTFVNERRVGRQLLAPGDSIKAGQTVLQFRMDHLKA